MDLIGKKLGLPKEIYEEHVIDETKKTKARKIVRFLVDSLDQSKGEVFNPFIDKLSEEFPKDAGYRWRQRQRFDNLVIMNTLCNAERRPTVTINDRKVPIVILEDLSFANSLSQDADVLPPHKKTWYGEIFLNAWKENSEEIEDLKISKPVLTGSRIKDYIEEKTRGKVNVKAIRETFLEPLYEHGYLDKTRDPRIYTRDVYWPVNENEKNKTSLIVITSFNASGVKSCLEKYLQRRFEYTYQNEILSEEQLVQNVIRPPQIVPKNDNDETTFDDVSETNDVKQRLTTFDDDSITNDVQRRPTTVDDDWSEARCM